MNFVIVPGILVCRRFLISACMFIVSKDLLISSATVIVRSREVAFAMVLFNVCSAVIVECCVAWVCLLVCKEDGSSPLFLQLLRGGMWACMRCPCLCPCWDLGWGLC